MSDECVVYRLCPHCGGDHIIDINVDNPNANDPIEWTQIECPYCLPNGMLAFGQINDGLVTIIQDTELKLDAVIGQLEDVSTSVLIFPSLFSEIVQGEFSSLNDSRHYFSLKFSNDSDTDGDQVDYTTYLNAGTYTFKLIHVVNTNLGIVKLLLDDVEKASIDTYAGVLARNYITTVPNIVVAEAGIVKVSLKIDGQNVSATGYKMNISAIYFNKTD